MKAVTLSSSSKLTARVASNTKLPSRYGITVPISSVPLWTEYPVSTGIKRV
jgi:hypothetical protein